MSGSPRIRKDIWRDDRVKIIHGMYSGKTGVVTKRTPTGALAHYVWIRFDGMRGGTIGPKFHVRNVQVLEMSFVHRKQRRANRNRRTSYSSSDAASGRKGEPDS